MNIEFYNVKKIYKASIIIIPTYYIRNITYITYIFCLISYFV